MQRIPMDALIAFGVEFLKRRGVAEDRAGCLATAAVETEAFLQSTHGLAQLDFMHAQIGEKIDPKADPVVIRDAGPTAVIEGHRSFGNLAMKKALELGTAKARLHGAAFVAVRNSEWIGALGYHLIPAARQGLLVHAWAQSSGCKDCAPVGGFDARFSTNPVAVVIPTDGDPVLADFSTATMSLSAAKGLAGRGQRTKTPRFLDAEGRPSDDPSVMDRGGTLLFAGGDVEGHKAYGLSLFCEALAVLAGGSANNPQLPQHQNFCMLVLDPAKFAGKEAFAAEMRRYVAWLKSSRVRPGFQGIRLPGERGFANLRDAKRNGVPLDDAKVAMLRRLAKDTGLTPPV